MAGNTLKDGRVAVRLRTPTWPDNRTVQWQQQPTPSPWCSRLNSIIDLAGKVSRRDRGTDMPEPIRGNDDAQAFFGVLSGRLKGAGGEDIAAEEQADIALAVIAIVKENHIVDVWSNDVAQNKMRNAIDDYFFDALRDHRGIELPVDLLDDLEQRLMDLARARFPD